MNLSLRDFRKGLLLTLAMCVSDHKESSEVSRNITSKVEHSDDRFTFLYGCDN